VDENKMKRFFGFLWKLRKGLLVIAILIGLGMGTWLLGQHFAWDWGGFWSNFISNAGSSAVIGFILYWIITRPDEKKANDRRRAQALSMLKIEFEINLERAKQYREVLKSPEQDLAPYYPLRFTRGAWNALRENGFLPQFEDIGFVYELLRLNEVLVVANKSLASVRSAKAGKNMKTKLARYSKKAINECAQIEKYLDPILDKLGKMNLPKIVLRQDIRDDPGVDELADNEPEGQQ
jgi:hypothetical protein